MNQFTTKYADSLQGVLSGFDRLVFHGTLRTLASAGGMKGYLSYCNVLWKDFADHAQQVTERIKQAAFLPYQEAKRPIEYLESPKTSKEELAKEIAAKDGIREGPICLLTSVEVCSGYDVSFNGAQQRLQLVARPRKFVARYYWSCHASEWATDVLFREAAVLKRLYPRLVEHGVSTHASPDVLRFLGKSVTASGEVPATFKGEITSDLKRRQEGMRIKHRCNQNSIKAYDKAYTPQGSVLRIETTLNNPTDFKVYRPKEGGPAEESTWRPLRKGVADLHRRAQVCQKSNERYLNALASVDTTQTLHKLTAQVACPTTWKDHRVRGINPLAAEDAVLLEAVSRGEFALNGLRNRDLQRLFYPTQAATTEEAQRRSAKVTRQLRMLRAHGIVTKVPHTHRYQVTEQGRKMLTAILTARQTPINQFLAKAA